MSEIPPNWVLARVGDLIDLGPKNECSEDTEVGFVPLQRLGVDYRSRHSFESKRWSMVKKGYTHFANGDVLLARITPSFENGKAGIARGLPNGIGAGSTEYFVCRPLTDALLPEYLLAHFKTPQFLRDGEQVMSGAVGQQRVPKQYVLDSRLPLAPLAEQKRIADKLDTLLARVDACRERLNRVPLILKRFRQAVLAAATSGQLTEEWREERRVGNNFGFEWEPVKLNDLCENSFYGPRFGRNEYTDTDSGVPTIRTTDMTDNGRIEITKDTPRVAVPSDKLENFCVRKSDLLVTRTGSIGMMAVFEGNYLAIPSAYLIRFRFSPRVLSRYVFFCLTAPYGQERLGLSATAITQPNINAEAIKRIEIQLPHVDEQHEIVRRVESLFAFVDRLEARYNNVRTHVERLTPALLAKAFRGELVPQDPNDEPASALLERIREARKAPPVKPKGPHLGRRPTMDKITAESVKDTIRQLPDDTFSDSLP